jgi:hypothetical protein
MLTHQDDIEETPLLQQPEQPIAVKARTPLPWDQFWIILVLHFSHSLVFKTLAPFTPQVSTSCLLLEIKDWLDGVLSS